VSQQHSASKASYRCLSRQLAARNNSITTHFRKSIMHMLLRVSVVALYLVASLPLSSPAFAAPAFHENVLRRSSLPAPAVCPFRIEFQRVHFEASILPEGTPLAKVIKQDAAFPCDAPVPGLATHKLSCDVTDVAGGGFAFVPISNKPDSTIIFLHSFLPRSTKPPAVVGGYIPFLTSTVSGGGKALAHTRVLFPIAPIRNLTNAEFGPRVRIGRSWFDVLDVAPANASLTEFAATKYDTLGLYRATERIAEIVQREQDNNGIPARKVFLLGHSQGGFQALHTAVRTDIPFAGVCTLAAELPLSGDYLGSAATRAANDGGKVYDFLMIHGTDDIVAPFQLGEASAEILTPIVEGFRRKLTFMPKKGLDHMLRLLVDSTVLANVSSAIVKSFA
jgi:predicted esterase